MKTPYDFISVAVFAGVVLLFLQRSVSPPPRADPLWHYLLAAIGCAIFNFVGNKGLDAAAIALLVPLLLFIALILKPFRAS
jgi:hypothetical protein